MVVFLGGLGLRARKGRRRSKGYWDRFGGVGAWELKGHGRGIGSRGGWGLVRHVNGVGRHCIVGKEGSDDREETVVAFIASRGCLRWYFEMRSEACM